MSLLLKLQHGGLLGNFGELLGKTLGLCAIEHTTVLLNEIIFLS